MEQEASFHIPVCRFGNVETGIENAMEGLNLLRILRVLDLEMCDGFWSQQFPICFDWTNRIYGIFNHPPSLSISETAPEDRRNMQITPTDS
jgi:hypothetical protein